MNIKLIRFSFLLILGCILLLNSACRTLNRYSDVHVILGGDDFEIILRGSEQSYWPDSYLSGGCVFRQIPYGEYTLFVAPRHESWTQECLLNETLVINNASEKFTFIIPDRTLDIIIESGNLPVTTKGNERFVLTKIEKLVDSKVDPDYLQWIFLSQKDKSDIWADKMYYAEPGIFKLSFCDRNNDSHEIKGYMVMCIFDNGGILQHYFSTFVTIQPPLYDPDYSSFGRIKVDGVAGRGTEQHVPVTGWRSVIVPELIFEDQPLGELLKMLELMVKDADPEIRFIAHPEAADNPVTIVAEDIPLPHLFIYLAGTPQTRLVMGEDTVVFLPVRKNFYDRLKESGELKRLHDIVIPNFDADGQQPLGDILKHIERLARQSDAKGVGVKLRADARIADARVVNPRNSMKLNDVNLMDLLTYIADVAMAKLRIADDGAIVFE